MFAVDITEFLKQECLRDYSASIAEIGRDAGPDTWRACVENASGWRFLKPENVDEFRRFVRNSGFGENGEAESMPLETLQTLCFQWIASDCRTCGITFPGDADSLDWQTLRRRQENGQVSSAVYRDDETGLIFWECAE